MRGAVSLPVSVRLGWATRGVDSTGLLAIVASASAFALGVSFVLSSRDPSAHLAYWVSAIFTAALVAVDFPGAAHARWSEFELSLPVAPRDRARASLLLSFGFWLAPLVAALSLGQLGAFGATQRLPALELLRSFASAMLGVLLAVALRHTLGLRLTGFRAAVRRVGMVAAVILGFARLSPISMMMMMAIAAPLLGIAHRAAGTATELRLPRVSTGVERAAQSTSFDRIALRHVLGSPYGLGLLMLLLIWVFAVNAGWLPSAGLNTLFILLWVAYHAAYAARLLRLDYLPIARERLFRFVAWPSLAAIALGVGLSLLLPAPGELCSLQERDGSITLKVPQQAWRLTTGEPPRFTAPSGESHSPTAHSFGLGSALVAYDPYEVPPQASRGFLLHQLGRLVADERGLELAPAELERRYLTGLDRRRRLDAELDPELADPRALRARLGSGAVLLVLGLVTLLVVIRPGAPLDARTWRRQPLAWLVTALFLLGAAQPLLAMRWRHGAEPITILLAPMSRALADHLLLVVLLASALGALLDRALLARFRQMEAPARAKALESGFVDI